MVTAIKRSASLAALALFLLLRVWLGVLGLDLVLGQGAAVLMVALLLACGWLRPLQLAAFVGAWMVWHWPLAAALIVAAPRLVLVLPGLISTLLARWRHPRPRWSSFEAAGPAAPRARPAR